MSDKAAVWVREAESGASPGLEWLDKLNAAQRQAEIDTITGRLSEMARRTVWMFAGYVAGTAVSELLVLAFAPKSESGGGVREGSALGLLVLVGIGAPMVATICASQAKYNRVLESLVAKPRPETAAWLVASMPSSPGSGPTASAFRILNALREVLRLPGVAGSLTPQQVAKVRAYVREANRFARYRYTKSEFIRAVEETIGL